MTTRERIKAIERAQSALLEAIRIMDALGAKKTSSELQATANRIKEIENLLEYELDEETAARIRAEDEEDNRYRRTITK